MPSAQRSITIRRPVDEVFAFFTTPQNNPKWRSHVVDVRLDEPLAVGATIRQRVSGPGGRHIPADILVTALESPSRYAFRVVAGPVRPEGVFRFVETDDGTRVLFSLTADLHGLRKLLSRPVQQAMDGEMAALDRAKELLESQ